MLFLKKGELTEVELDTLLHVPRELVVHQQWKSPSVRKKDFYKND